MSLNEKDLLMLYHTSVRNVFLITSVSLGLLSYSRFFRTKGNDLYNLAFIIISLLFLCASLLIAKHVRDDITTFLKTGDITDKSRINRLLIVPEGILIVNSLIGFFGAYTFVRQLNLIKN